MFSEYKFLRDKGLRAWRLIDCSCYYARIRLVGQYHQKVALYFVKSNFLYLLSHKKPDTIWFALKILTLKLLENTTWERQHYCILFGQTTKQIYQELRVVWTHCLLVDWKMEMRTLKMTPCSRHSRETVACKKIEKVEKLINDDSP